MVKGGVEKAKEKSLGSKTGGQEEGSATDSPGRRGRGACRGGLLFLFREDFPYRLLMHSKQAIAEDLYERRKSKGMTLEAATREVKNNPNMFGTMMMARDMADGMVSGACHTTADTMRPALQVMRLHSWEIRIDGGRGGGGTREEALVDLSSISYFGISREWRSRGVAGMRMWCPQ